jgi:hypothetical protein
VAIIHDPTTKLLAAENRSRNAEEADLSACLPDTLGPRGLKEK